jgi:hypothetical protein
MLTKAKAEKIWYHKGGKLYWRVSMGPSIVRDTEVGTKNGEGYLQVKYQGQTYKVHRLIYLMEYGTLPPLVDHEDTNRLNNNPGNLRAATSVENAQNRSTPVNNTTGAKGIDVYRGKARARIVVDGKRETIGLFSTIEEAKAARDKLTAVHHGDFAKES